MLKIEYYRKMSFGRIFWISVTDQNEIQDRKMPNLDIVSELRKKWGEIFSKYGKMYNPYLHEKISPESFEEACVRSLVGNRTANAAMHRLIALARERDVTLSCVTDSLGSWYAKILARVCERTAKDLKVQGA